MIPTLAALVAATAGLDASAPAAQPRIEVTWSAPEACPDADSLVEEIEGYLGQAIDTPRSQWIRASARVEQRDDAWSLALSISNREGTAETAVESPTCEALAELAALKIAMAIDPLAVLDAMQREEPPAPVPHAEPETSEPPALAPPKDAKPDRGAVLRLFTAGGWGVLPGIGPGIGGSVALAVGRWRIEGGGSFWFPRTADAGLAVLRLGAGHLRGCGVPSRRALEFPLCFGAEAGIAHGRGLDLAVNRTSRQPWVGISASPGLTWVVSPRSGPEVGLWIAPEVLVSVVRPGFALEGEPAFHRAAPAAARLAAGVELRFL